MTREPRDPNRIPDDAGGGELAAYVGEDVGRMLALRVAALVAALCLVAGVATDADQGTRAAGIVAGSLALLTLLVSQLGGWRRTRQWLLMGAVLVACGGLFAVLLAQHRSAG